MRLIYCLNATLKRGNLYICQCFEGYGKAFQSLYLKPFKGTFRKGMPNQEQEQEQEQDNNNNTHEDEYIKKRNKGHTRKTFAIDFNWRPDKTMFAAYCQRKLVKPSQLKRDLFNKFVDKVSAKGESKTEAQWCENLASYLKTCLSNPPKPTQQQKPITRICRHRLAYSTNAES